VPTLLTLMILPVLIALGIWQLGRADEKRAILAERAAKEAMPALDVTAQSADHSNDIAYRQLRVSGTFDPRYRIYIDNKVHKGRVGYQIVEPLVFSDGETAVLVNRGWLAGTASRAQLPTVPEIDAPVTITGIAKIKTRDVASFGAGNRSGENWPALVRWVDIGELQQSIPYKLKNFLLLQTNPVEDGLIREWEFVSSPPEKNQSYAMQWFTMAVALILIYLVVNLKRTGNQEEKHE